MRVLRPTGWSRQSALFLVLVLICAACAPSTARGIVPAATVEAHAPRYLPASAWEHIALPASASDIQGVAVSPIDPATLFACTTQPQALWRTTDAGAHWTRYALTFGGTGHCSFSFAPDDSGRVTFQVEQPSQDAQPCAHDSFYLSMDGGETWHMLPRHVSIAPAKASYGWCELHVTRHHLFLAYSYALSNQSPQVSLLERSDDEGISWVRADRGLGGGSLFFMPEVGPGETLAMTVVHVPETPMGSEGPRLVTSRDAGDTWQQISTPPNGVGTYLLASPPRAGSAWPSPDHPFYALEHEQIPSNLYRERVAVSGDGQQWTLLPELPVSGASELRAGILQVLSVLPDGRLAIWGPDPSKGLPSEQEASKKPVSAFWLWLWDPAAQTWQAMPSPLRVTASEGCGLCWGATSVADKDGVVYLYVSRFYTSPADQEPPGWFRVRIS
ncbi:MAG TPA: hypothetical protein VF040_16450 [Ktedonobacterales bacterium]